MIIAGTLINVATVVAGSLIGIFAGNRIHDRYHQRVFDAVGLFTLVLGVSMALKGSWLLVIVFALILGALLGECWQLDRRLDQVTAGIKNRFSANNDQFAEGLVTAFLLFCMGSMTILGAFDEGLRGNTDLLLTKSILDGFSSIALASALGAGVLFSVVPLLIYQGGLTILASQLGSNFPPEIIDQLTATGGILLVGLGISILQIRKINIINLLPSLVLVVIFAWAKWSWF